MVIGLFHNLVHLEHSVRYLIKVSSAYYIDFSINQTNLDGLKIMWKVIGTTHCMLSNSLRLAIVQVELLRVFLHDVNE